MEALEYHTHTFERNGYSVVSFGNRSAESQAQGMTRPVAEKWHDIGEFLEDIRRVQNTSAWRRLQGIYQFNIGQGHNHENRLTHSVGVQNVAQIICRKLKLDRNSGDLVRSIAVIHDIGHMPFGHDGEAAANEKLKHYGKTWTHDAAGLRVVTEWSNHGGLNMTLDSLEGLTKRYWRYMPDQATDRFNHPINELPDCIRKISDTFDLHLNKQDHIEGQIAAVADWIAFTASDIEDGLRSGRMSLQEVFTHFPLTRKIYDELHTQYEKAAPLTGALEKAKARQYKYQLPKLLATRIQEELISDLVKQTQANIGQAVSAKLLKNAEDVRDLPQVLVTFSPEIFEEMDAFGKYCKDVVFKRLEEAHGPLQTMVELTIDDIVDGRLVMPREWRVQYIDICDSTDNEQACTAALTELACTYMTCVMDDQAVADNVKRNHRDFWDQHFNDKTASSISPAGIRKSRLSAEKATGLS